jgi:transcriptional regulator with XRE-family HTH domain
MTASTGERDDRENAARDYPEGPGDIPADTFALRLMASRHHAGRLSIEQAAARCGLNSGNWAHWENGRRPLDKYEVAQDVAEGLGMNLKWLLEGGPLLPARGRPTRKARRITDGYPRVPVYPTRRNPIGGAGGARYPSTKQAVRRPRVIDRNQPVAA